MKHVKGNTLVAGATYDGDLFIEKDTLFLAKGLPLCERDIARLTRWGYHTLYMTD